MKLPAENDPIGAAIEDYFEKGEADHLWVYSDIADRDEMPVNYLFRSFQKMPILEQKALELCEGKILDVGAAAGSHSLHLRENGKEVTAIDISERAVETIRNRGLEHAHCVDFYTFMPKEKFDTLLFLMNGIGIAETLKGLEKFFAACHLLLNTGGKILLDSSDLNYMFDEEDEKPLDKYYGEVTYVMRYGDIVSDNFKWLFIDFESLKTAALKSGFRCEKIMDGGHFDFLAELRAV